MAKKHDDGDRRLKRKEYEKEIGRLQGELCKLQDWVSMPKSPQELTLTWKPLRQWESRQPISTIG